MRSQVHMLTVAAARLEQEHGNPTLITALHAAAEKEAMGRAEGRRWTPEENQRVERQRTLFAYVPDSQATTKLKLAMLQRVYDLMWDGDCAGADALAEFLPSGDVEKLFADWDRDQDGRHPRSQWYEGAHCVVPA